MTQRPLVVLVHGAWHDSSVWSETVPRLADAGYESVAPNLPGVDRAPGRDDLQGHVDTVVELANRTGRDVVLVGHSYGGAVITDVGDRVSRLRGVVYFAGFLLEKGQSCDSQNASEPGSASGEDAMVATDADHVLIDAAAAREAFYHDVTEADALYFSRRLTPEHRLTIGSPVTHESWRTVPAAYVVATRDQAIVPAVQRAMSRHAQHVAHLEASHSGMISQPDEFVRLLVEALDSLA